MRILLVGEYSGFHNALKHGLQKLGHTVTLVSTGDGFKKYPADINVDTQIFDRFWILQKFRNLVFRITKKDIRDYLLWLRFRESEHLLKNHDIVQFINSNAFNTHHKTERKVIDFLLRNNKSIVLAACGDDVPYAKYLNKRHEGYSILTPYKMGQIDKAGVSFTVKYLKLGYRSNYDAIMEKAKAIIPSNTDYLMPLKNEAKVTEIIPAAIQTHKLKLKLNHDLSVIQIFMGINRHNYWKKGINYFEAALKIIEEKYVDLVNVTIAENLPYSDYVKSYDNAHILLDQVLCYDQGYNALEAMAQGKVVFAGASDLYLKAHGLERIPAVDSKPDINYLVDELSKLIENPELILKIGKQAREHVLDYHNSIKVAAQYLEIYNQ
ncbi:MAG: glycosyltransferase [Nonlabens sp.]